jgi:hypothetical protein
MGDRLANALRRYERIRPEPRENLNSFKAEELADWIERDVGPLVVELSRRPTFQTLARWPLEHLMPGAASLERKLIESVELRLTATAQALAAVARKTEIAPALTATFSAATASVEARSLLKRSANQGKGDADGDAEADVDARCNAVKEWQTLSGSLMEFIAQRPWLDLTSSLDFFGPAADLNLKDRAAYTGPDTSPVQIGVFLPYCNPRLRLLGDFVSRMLLIRVEHWQQALRGFFSHYCSSIRPEVRSRNRSWSAAEGGYAQLDAEARQLRQMLLGGSEAKLREAAIALVQIHAAFQPQSDFSWLGAESPSVAFAAQYRDAIEHRQNVALPEQIAASLAEFGGIYRSDEDPEETLRQALVQYSLVVVEAPGRREAYWKGAATGDRWSQKNTCWQFLVALAEVAKLKLGVDAFNVDCSVKDARSRIKGIIPQELDSLIRPAGRGTYTLNLVPEQICILRVEAEDRLATQL